MTKTRIFMMYLLTVVIAVSFALPALAANDWRDDGPRYERAIRGERDLLDVFAAGLVADAFGYDASEILRQVESEDIPTQDIIPVFYASYLSGRSFQRVVELRAEGKDWGQTLTKLGVSADTLNEMTIPRDITINNLNDVPDQVYEDLFVCSAVAQVFELNPNEIFEYYDNGWSSIDVMAAAQIAYRTNQRISLLLRGDAKRVDWYYTAQHEDVDLRQVVKDQGRLFDNITPILSDQPEQGDLETGYAADIVVRNWDVPLRDVQYARYHYLLSPPELLQVFYLSDVKRCGWEWVVQVYTRDSYYRWGPTLVVLDVPFHHFSSLSIWDGGRYDYMTVDPWLLDHALLGYALTYRSSFSIGFYMSTFDPWYPPYRALSYCGAWYRWGIPYREWDDWHHAHPSRPYWEHPYIAKDYGDFRRSNDWAGGRRVSIVVGDKDRRHDRDERRGLPPTWNSAYKTRGHDTVAGNQHPGMTVGRVREGMDYGAISGSQTVTARPRPGGALPEQGDRRDDWRPNRSVSPGRDFGRDDESRTARTSRPSVVIPRDDERNEQVRPSNPRPNQERTLPGSGNTPTVRRGQEYGSSTAETERERDRQSYMERNRGNDRGTSTERSRDNEGPRVIYRNNDDNSVGNPPRSNNSEPRVQPSPRTEQQPRVQPTPRVEPRIRTRDYGNAPVAPRTEQQPRVQPTPRTEQQPRVQTAPRVEQQPRVQTAPRVEQQPRVQPTPRVEPRSNTRDYGAAPATPRSERQVSPQRENTPRPQVVAPSSENRERERVSPGRPVGSVSGGRRNR